jgi:hypothetical protein
VTLQERVVERADAGVEALNGVVYDHERRVLDKKRLQLLRSRPRYQHSFLSNKYNILIRLL